MKKFLAVVVAGIVFGILFECIINNHKKLFDFFLQFDFDTISKTKINYDRLLCIIIEKRISVIILILLLGLTSGGKSLINIFVFWNSSCMGVILVEILKYRIFKGVLCFLSLLLPQYLFYVPAIFLAYYQINDWYLQKDEAKKLSNKIFLNKLIKYLLSFSFVLLLVLIGILAETYINPVLVKKIVKIM